jgi:proteic killer suppression protein
MIKSFCSKETFKIWNGERSKRLPFEIQDIARRKLRMIQASENLNDLRIPPANRLEKLSGSEFHSIRINDQWRIIFKWINNSAEEVEIVDYH